MEVCRYQYQYQYQYLFLALQGGALGEFGMVWSGTALSMAPSLPPSF